MESYLAKGSIIKAKCRGFSLIELIVALVIGLVIVLGAGQIYLLSIRTYDQMESLAQRQESLRSVVDFLSLDVRTATDVIQASGTTLTLSFDPGVRPSDPYCGGSGYLSSVQYGLSGSAIQVATGCDGNPVGQPEDLVIGVIPGSGVSFSQPSDFYLAVQVAFETIGDEPSENAIYDFIIARRSEIL